MKKKFKLGVIGCGNIASTIADFVNKKFLSNFTIVALNDINTQNAIKLSTKLCNKPKITTINNVIKFSDIILESASPSVVPIVAKTAFKYTKPVLYMSISGVLLNPWILRHAEHKNCKIYLPSGAIAGIDAIKSAAVARINKVTLTTSKPPKGLIGAPYLVKHKIDITNLRKPKTVFTGSVKQAVKNFPVNINVAAMLALAVGDTKKISVKIVADPNIEQNIHEIMVESKVGTIVTRTENIPSPDNPKTSYLAVLSAITVLKQISLNIRIGT